MSVVSHIDNENRLIYLHSDTVNQSIHPLDIYREVRALRWADTVNQGHNQFMRGDGYIPKGGGKFTERYFTLLDGARIVPYDVTHVLSITGTLLTDDGQEGVFAFNRTPLSIGVYVDIQYIPQQVEVITVQAGSGLSDAQNTLLEEIHAGTNRIVHVDANNIVSGNGSPSNPFNSVTLATAYAELKGIKKIYIHSDVTLDDDLANLEITGLSQPTINLNGRSVESCDFFNINTGGSSTGSATYRHCNILDGTSGLNGIYHECAISGDVTMLAGGYVIVSDSFSGIAGTTRPSIDMNGNGTESLAMRRWSGGIELRNIVDGNAVTIGIVDGECRFAPSCTGGDIHVRGTGFYENLGTCVVEDRAFISKEDTQLTQEQHDALMASATTADTIIASQL